MYLVERVRDGSLYASYSVSHLIALNATVTVDTVEHFEYHAAAIRNAWSRACAQSTMLDGRATVIVDTTDATDVHADTRLPVVYVIASTLLQFPAR